MITITTFTDSHKENKWEFTGILEGKAYFKFISGDSRGCNNYSTKIRRHYGKTYINGSWTFGNWGKKIFMDKYIKQFIKNLNVN